MFLIVTLFLATTTHGSVPIVYRSEYGSSFFGLGTTPEGKCQKLERIATHLKERYGIEEFYVPEWPTDTELLRVHSVAYLQALGNSSTVAKITKNKWLTVVPSFMLRGQLIAPARWAAGGTVLAAQLALEHGWSINLGGGVQQAGKNGCASYGFFADIPLAIQTVRDEHPEYTILIIDLGAQRACGLASYVSSDKKTVLCDMYNENLTPVDRTTKRFITYPISLKNWTTDRTYLELLRTKLPAILDECTPDLIFYNAGVDIYAGDSSGKLRISRKGIIERDALVFGEGLKRAIPIVMTLSDGLSDESAEIVCRSLDNLIKKFKLIT